MIDPTPSPCLPPVSHRQNILTANTAATTASGNLTNGSSNPLPYLSPFRWHGRRMR